MSCPYCGDGLAGGDLKECFHCMVIWGKHHIFVFVPPRACRPVLVDWIELPEGVLLIRREVGL